MKLFVKFVTEAQLIFKKKKLDVVPQNAGQIPIIYYPVAVNLFSEILPGSKETGIPYIL